jgi:hypothetical protein
MKRFIALTSATAAVAAAATATPAPAAALTRDFEGTVVSVDRSSRTFRLRDAERGTVRIRVTRRTTFERLSGLRALRRGAAGIEVTARRRDGRWVALHVERSGGGGHHGGGRDHPEDD